MISSPSREAQAPTPGSLATFNSFLIRNHVQRALRYDDGNHNCIPMGLSTIRHLNGTPEQLQALYDANISAVPSWSLSPGRVNDFEQRQRFLGDPRFQRAYMDYFSQQHGQLKGNAQALLSSELFQGDKPLMFGLFGGFGHPFVLLGDAIELQNPILMVEALVLAAVDWSNPLYELMSDPHLQQAESPASDREVIGPEAILDRIAYDGRFSGIMKSGPGFQHINLILSSPSARAAVIEYAALLDLRHSQSLIDQLADLAVLLLCGTHKRAQPAFDYYLAQLISLVHSLSVILRVLDSPILIRGAWMLYILAYVSQMRPVVDQSLVLQVDVGEDDFTWDDLLSEFRARRDSVRGKYLDTDYLRALRSLVYLGQQSESQERTRLCLSAAWKLRLQWRNWVGKGTLGEDTLNIRL